MSLMFQDPKKLLPSSLPNTDILYRQSEHIPNGSLHNHNSYIFVSIRHCVWALVKANRRDLYTDNDYIYIIEFRMDNMTIAKITSPKLSKEDLPY